MPITRSCDRCGVSYTRSPALAGKFCSKACSSAAQRKPVINSRYRMLYAPGHPLCGDRSYIAEHRVILWDKIGPGTHPCYRCGQPVTWAVGTRTSRKEGVLTVDHVDRDKHNNDPGNLQPCCFRCQMENRDYTVADDEVFVVRKNGSRLRGERRSCGYCGSPFVATWNYQLKNWRRYCSRSCSVRMQRQKEIASQRASDE